MQAVNAVEADKRAPRTAATASRCGAVPVCAVAIAGLVCRVVLRGRAAGLLAVFLDLHRDGAMRRCKVNQEAHFAEARCDADEEAVGDVGGGEASNNVETSRVWLGVLPLGDGGVREWGGGDLSTGARRPQTRTPSR